MIRPEYKLVWDLMPVLVTCKFDKDPIKNEHASMDTSFPHYSLWEIFPVLKGAQHWMIQSGWMNWTEILPVLDTCKFCEDQIKNDLDKVETPFFSHHK